MLKAYDIKKGNVLAHNGQAWRVHSVEKSSPTARGGNTTYRFALYSVPGNNKFDLSLRAKDTMDEIELTQRPMTFSYMDGDAFVFLDSEDYTPYLLDPAALGDAVGYITESLEDAQIVLIEGDPVALQMPQSVVMEVAETPPELKGSSATKRNKPAKLTTGIEILVPEYIVNGEKVWVNTETGEFSGRA